MKGSGTAIGSDYTSEPSAKLLKALAIALKEARYPNVAGHLLAGFLWAVYPEWYERNLKPSKTKRLY